MTYKNNTEREGRTLSSLGLTIAFTLIVFFILLISIFIALLIILALAYMGLYTPAPNAGGGWLIAYIATVSVLVSLVASFIFSRFPLRPIRQVINASEELAKGKFDVRIHLKGPRELRKLNQSFNHMAEELGSLELLRSDFVNNFSHEFKTPIVSLKGFAKILKRQNLSPEERDEYLDIIIAESERLAELATNVLNLSKIENQTIIADKELFNVTEQIRQAVVLLDQKWTSKNINFQFESTEIMLRANEDLLSQVWINLLDNAIKFSPKDVEIYIQIHSTAEQVEILISDNGPGIDVDKQKYIFDKFYQGDTSHSTYGNGLGLSIAQKIVMLHGGNIQITKSDETGTTFKITLSLT
ncbi:HAMP domain-containing histidine kinase [Paenibacillus sp. HN-1]|uniref:HAMP domain-containing sensor histidine kinase n=1 Tax=Paenibacillus TaxID=44249 RepID=UPI001CA92496|nr:MULTISPECIES: HAMP domain-containing sensor histidine kinase [Paenibacillus]MBY9078338.1 HAMP domain-containing histidine kinase [Paenibacillus sp. CGMCC 1.18879]MBY9083150.1 HAMP domain-containing histidine kinase [Paenibacillus sinensis]